MRQTEIEEKFKAIEKRLDKLEEKKYVVGVDVAKKGADTSYKEGDFKKVKDKVDRGKKLKEAVKETVEEKLPTKEQVKKIFKEDELNYRADGRIEWACKGCDGCCNSLFPKRSR